MSTANAIATLFDSTAYLVNKKARYGAVAGRVSTLRSAIRRIEIEIEQTHRAVDAEEDGAELLLAGLPSIRAELARLALLIDPLEREEREVIRALESYGINVQG